ncbi:hypothetical protein IQ22_04379 [Pseudomonas duriflava]|uniref:Uncharacterized protein n=1 Tax=Pseudomonas duriflava TaxID=459528 RepID=A0A562PSQ9_9PSED|nr:hypothetical protein [Pseudomonas duriflava]TWI47106.1 hypothetical protein IQ22_04379 [Pseudomonas duriflava]
MRSINEVFQRWKVTLERRYGDGFPAEFVDTAHENLLAAYASFHASGCADSKFLRELCSSDVNKSAQRLGEILLFERLKHAGYDPKPSHNGWGPDFLVQQDGKKICLELITPSTGDDLKINRLFSSHKPLEPCPHAAIELRQRTLLRMTAAIAEKLGKYEGYLSDGVVSSQDVLVIVVNDALLCPDTFFYGVSHNADSGVGGQSLAEHAVYGFGHSVWEPDNEGTNYILRSTFREFVDNRPEPKRDGSARGPVPVSLFKTPDQQEAAEIAQRASVISAVLQVTLREDYGVLMLLREKAETEERLIEGQLRPGVLAVNPRAVNPLYVPLQHGLMKMVDAPPLSLKEAWDLKNRELKMILGEGYKEQPFPH